MPRLALTLLLLLVQVGAATAASWDPRFRWRTLRTDHFAIQFHQGEEQLAEELALVAEEVHELLVPYIGWAPRGRTQVVIADSTDSANGYATPVPYNTVVLYAVQPTTETSLDTYEDWLFALFVHEYAHILQIDLIGGIPQVVRWLLGRLITPGGVLPRWGTEGFATWIETRTTAGGRGRSTYTDALMRLAALDDRLPRIDEADGLGRR